jgi:TolB-like protein
MKIKVVLLALVTVLMATTIYAGGKFYNYYEEGLAYMKRGDWDRAIEEFKAAVSLEFKDRPNVRTYGMHFIDYFPHREMGVCYYNLGDTENAAKQLQISQAFSPSKRTSEFLAKLGKGEAPPPQVPAGISREEQDRLAREKAQIEADKRRLADQMAALELKKKAQDEDAARKAAEEERRLAAERDRLAKLEADRLAKERELLSKGQLPTGALTYDASRVTQVGTRLSLAILPFDNKGGNPEVASMVQDNMITTLYNLRRFKILERSKIDEIVKEQKLGMTGFIDPAKAVKVGKVIGVDAILMGSISSTATGVAITARLIDTETGTIITAKDAFSDQSSLQNIKGMSQDIAIQIYNDVPLVEGYVIKVDPTQIILDVGTNKGMRKGMKMVIYKEGDAITHPATGEILGKTVTKLGEVLLMEVQEKMSEASILEKEQGQALAVGNKVVAK